MKRYIVIILFFLSAMPTKGSAMQQPNKYTQMFLDAFLAREIQSADPRQNALLIKNCTQLCGNPELLTDAISLALRLLSQLNPKDSDKGSVARTTECLHAILNQIPRFYIQNAMTITWINENEIFFFRHRGHEIKTTKTAQILDELVLSIAEDFGYNS